MKIVIRFFLLLLFFVSFWFGLSQINWIQILQVEKVTDSTEEKLAEVIRNSIERSEEIIRDKEIKDVIDSIVHKISNKNRIDATELNILIVNNPQVNAFALPDKHLVIFTGLIEACDNPEALSGVIAHELAHIELNHVMKKLAKEVGISVLFSITSNSGGEVLGEVTKALSSSAYDRSLEEEADENALRYLLNTNIDPEPLAEFFYKLSLDEPEFASKVQWLSTHPDSKERAKNILDEVKGENQSYESVISIKSWDLLKEKVNSKMEQENF
ncbi:M48 family metallopeptidase [Marivirga sp.]|uniref:M48 family metallopeptidase n=1 Tax=Marivirga sp. TaxID=2018662 RepID=UPI002D80AB83|nr:M48 family metallopeptidase [Marivirga sp.]HET8861578.1 M48 family metallopeptidase [Marivirga sp.]